MRYALEKSDGVLMTCGYTPLPEGAIEPVPNWHAMLAVPYEYRKLVAGVVTEMTQAEKDAVDAAHVITEEEAQKALDDSDWYIVRESDNGHECPQEVKDMRQEMRELL